MLYCQLILLKGDGNATLTCKIQPHIDTRVAYNLRGLPLGGTLIVGDGTTRHAAYIDALRGTANLPPLETAALWAAYLDREGRCLAWGTADGKWHEYLAAHLYDYAEAQKPRAVSAETPALSVPTDLADLGVVAVEWDTARAARATASERPANSVVEGQDEQALEALRKAPAATETPAHETPAPIADPGEMPSQRGEDTPAGHVVEAQPFFAEDVARLLAAFEEYPPYAPLMQRIEGSRWVEVNAGEEDAYLLGLLYDSTPAPTHLVYGVKGQRLRPFAPDAEWLSASDDTPDEGWWLIYYNL